MAGAGPRHRRVITKTRPRARRRTKTSPNGQSGRTYTVDQLAAATGVPSRTIRFYQSKGALRRPQRSGRQAFYTEAHVEQLGLVAQLQDRGLRLSAIRDFLKHVDRGDLSLHDWLGFGDQLQRPWSEDAPRILTEAQLRSELRRPRPGAIAELLWEGFIEPQGKGHYLVRRPAQLSLLVRLDELGIDLGTGAGAGNILRRHLGRAADELVKHFSDRLGAGFGRSPDPAEITKALEGLRPLASEGVRLLFAEEIERALGSLFKSGQPLTRTSAK